MRSQYPAAQSRPQRPDWRVSLTTQERPRRPSSPGVEPRLRELGSQQPRLSPGSEFVEAYRGRPTPGMAPWSQAFWDLDTLRVPDAPLVPDSRVAGGQVADRPTTGRGGFPTSFQPHPTACSCVPAFRAPARPTYPELCTVGTTDPERGQAETRGAARPPRPTPGPLARLPRPSSRPATGAPGRRRYHPFLARHFLPAQPAVPAHLRAGSQPSALPLFARCLKPCRCRTDNLVHS